MGRLTSAGVDDVLTSKMRKLLLVMSISKQSLYAACERQRDQHNWRVYLLLTCLLCSFIPHRIRHAVCDTTAPPNAQLGTPINLAIRNRAHHSERAFESPYESKGKGPVMSYEKFVQLLDTEDPVAQSAIDYIVHDVFKRARSRKQAIEEARQYHQPTYSSVAAAAAARRDQSGEQTQRTWHGEVPSLSQRLHGWRYLNADDPDRQQRDQQAQRPTPSHDNADEYDAIIADAQRQVASPLPMPGLGSTQQDSRSYHLDPLFDSLDWPDLNSSAAYGHEESNGWSDSESEPENTIESSVQAVERALAAVRTQRDTSRTNLTRLSTISAASRVPTTSASRLRILQRLEQRRRNLMDRAEQERSSTNNNRPYPSYFSTSFSRTATNNINSDPPVQNDSSIPIIVGGDFSELPSSSGEARQESNETIRANYGPLQRNNSIRRSGFHANRAQQSSPPNVTAAANAAHALLPRSTSRPVSTLQPRSPLSISRSINEPSDTYFSNRELRAHRQQLDTLFGRQGSEVASEQEASSQSREADSFEDFSRTSRLASRLAREGESAEQATSEGSGQAASTSASVELPRFLLSPSSDPMLGATPIDGDAVNELLGSSSSVAGLGSMSAGTSASRVPYVASDGRRNIIPPRAPILSRRSFPLDSTPPPPAFDSSANAANTPTAASSPASGGQQPQRSNSVPARGQIYRREEILSLAQFLNEDSTQTPRNDS